MENNSEQVFRIGWILPQVDQEEPLWREGMQSQIWKRRKGPIWRVGQARSWRQEEGRFQAKRSAPTKAWRRGLASKNWGTEWWNAENVKSRTEKKEAETRSCRALKAMLRRSDSFSQRSIGRNGMSLSVEATWFNLCCKRLLCYLVNSRNKKLLW